MYHVFVGHGEVGRISFLVERGERGRERGSSQSSLPETLNVCCCRCQ